MLKKNSVPLLFLVLTSCCRQDCCNRDPLEIPYSWQSLKAGMTLEDPSCFIWWRALNDSILTSLVMETACRNRDVLLARLESTDRFLQSIDETSVEVGKNYIEFRGLQLRLKILNERIAAQKSLLALSKDLSTGGFSDETKDNEEQRNLELLFVEQSSLNCSKEKILFHLSTLLNYPPQLLAAMLCPPQDLPSLPKELPLGSPNDLICQNLSIKEARTLYTCSKTRKSLYNYEKVVLTTLESAETALAVFYAGRDQLQRLESAKSLQDKTYQLTKYLNSLGLKNDREVLLAFQALLSDESTLIQAKVDLLNSYMSLYQIISNS